MQREHLSRLILILRWVARIGSLASICVLAMFLLGSGFDPAKINLREWIDLVFFPLGVVMGLAIAWWKEGLGGAIALASLACFYVIYRLLLSGVLPQGLAFATFSAPAGLFLISWFLSRHVGRILRQHLRGFMRQRVQRDRLSALRTSTCP